MKPIDPAILASVRASNLPRLMSVLAKVQAATASIDMGKK